MPLSRLWDPGEGRVGQTPTWTLTKSGVQA